mgnify:CR=1 FL=1
MEQDLEYLNEQNYLSDRLSEEQLFVLTYNKGKSKDSVKMLKVGLNSFDRFTKDVKGNRSRHEVLSDLIKLYNQKKDSHAAINLLVEFKNWLDVEHTEIKIVGSNQSQNHQKKVGMKGINIYLRQVKKWLKYCGNISLDPDRFKDIVIIPTTLIDEEEVKPITHDELKEVVMRTNNPQRRAKFLFMASTGSRHLESLRI